MTEEKSNQKQAGSELKTFSVPFDLGGNQANITIITNTPTKPSKEELIKKAFNFHSQGNIPEAAKYYQFFINQGFNDHRVFSNYANILINLGKLEEAELSLRKAIELKPDYTIAHSNLGNILIDLGKLEEAELSLRKAIELKPDFAEAFSSLGGILVDLGKLQEAEMSTRKALELNPDLANAYNNLGIILRDLGNLKEAELSLRKAVEINPDYPEAHLNLGNILTDLGKLQEAEISTRKALELNPDLANAHNNLGIILQYLGKSEELLLLSKLTLEIRSINQGDKLLALLRITITHLLKKDFPKILLNINKIKELISKGAVNNIKDEKNKKYFLSFFLFITSLYPLLEKNSNNLDLDKIPHIGESHSLCFAHQTLSISSKYKKIQPVLITGGKAWYFAKQGNNQWKESLKQQLKNHTYSDYIFISFGEIDCKKDENMLTYAINKDEDISAVCEKTIKNYLNHMEKILSPIYSKRYYFGVPAPTMKKESPDELDIKRNEMIKIFNSLLRQEVLSMGSYFLDVYELTSTEDGENNNLYMCDKTHLSPRCLAILFENHLYVPDSNLELTS